MGDRATFHLSGCAAGAASINIKYQNGNNSPVRIYVNGAPAETQGTVAQGAVHTGTVMLRSTGGWERTNWGVQDTQVRLRAGHNTVTIETAKDPNDPSGPNSGLNLDRIEVQAGTPTGEALKRGAARGSRSLPNAVPESQSLRIDEWTTCASVCISSIPSTCEPGKSFARIRPTTSSVDSVDRLASTSAANSFIDLCRSR